MSARLLQEVLTALQQQGCQLVGPTISERHWFIKP